MDAEMFNERQLRRYDIRQLALNRRAAIRDIMFHEYRPNQPHLFNTLDRRHHNQPILDGQNNRVHNPIPVAYYPYEQIPYDHNPYDHNPYNYNPYAHHQYAHHPYGHHQYGHHQYGHHPYGHHQYGHHQYGHHQYDPQINLQMYHQYYNGQNAYVFNEAHAYQPQPQAQQQQQQQPQPQPQQQFNIDALSGYNFVPSAPPMINTDGTPVGLYNVINPAPCFCDAYTMPGGSLDLTACSCDVCLRLCRHEPLHICIVDNPPPPDCTNCGSPRNLSFPHNCNVCYPVGVVCCEEACTLDEIVQHMQNSLLGNNQAPPQPQ